MHRLGDRMALASALGAAGLCVLLLLTVGTATARAGGTIEVKTTSDLGSPTCTPSSGTCTLRQVLELTETNLVGGDLEIRVEVSGTIEVAARGPLVIDPAPGVETLEIVGPGSAQLAIDGGEQSEIFAVKGGYGRISGLTLTHGVSSGSGGGAIHQTGGNYSVFGVLFEENSTLGGLPGGAIMQEGGDLSVSESTFGGNHAKGSPTDPGDGGAVFVDSPEGELNLESTDFFANRADDNGGAIYVAAGEARIRGGELKGNEAGFDGGAVLTESPDYFTTEDGVSFVGNEARHGGGLMVRAGAGTTRVTESWFSENEAGVQGGGLYADAATTVERSTFSGNASPSDTEHSGGGIATGEVPLTVNESTLTANVGGAIDLGLFAPVTIRGSTIVANTDPNNVGAGVAGEATVTSSILYGNQGSEGEGNCEGTMISGGHNIVGTPGEFCGWETAAGDVFGVDPLLGGLTDNGGPTPTIAPVSRLSPAINHGSEPGPKDQRGLTRPIPAGVANTDVGAVEVQAPRNEAKPAISPDSHLRSGEVLTCVAGSWDVDTVEDASRTYVWLLDGAEVGTGATYTLQESDVNGELGCRETVDDGATTATAESSPVEMEPGQPLLLPAGLDFGSRNVGSGPSAPQTLTLSNPGGTALAVGTAGITGTNGSQFRIDSSCPVAPLPPGGECEFEVSFEPTGNGPKTATFTVQTAEGSPTAELSGTGTVPNATITPSLHDFGRRQVGTGPGAPTTFAVKNTGDGPLTIGAVGLGGDDQGSFVLLSGGDDCSDATLRPGEECDVDVAFEPQASGPQSASLVVPSDAPTATAMLGGTGTEAGFEATPSALEFGPWEVGAGPSAPRTVSVFNDGDAPMELGAVTVDGSEMALVGGASDTCSQQILEPGDTCSVAVVFDPSAVGAVAAQLEFPGAPAGSAVALTGTGVVSDLVAEPASLEFGNVELGKVAQRTVTVTNQGLAPVLAGTAELTGSARFSVLDDGCAGRLLAPRGSCELAVAFAAQTGPQAATLSLAPQGDGAAARVDLAGTGLGPLAIDPLPVTPATPPAVRPACRVPKLVGRTLEATRRALRRRGCKLGAVAGRKRREARVAHQHPQPGRTLPAGAAVAVKVGARTPTQQAR